MSMAGVSVRCTQSVMRMDADAHKPMEISIESGKNISAQKQIIIVVPDTTTVCPANIIIRLIATSFCKHKAKID